MRKFFVFFVLVVLGSSLSARDDVLHLDLASVLNSQSAKEVLDPKIKLIFGSGYGGKILLKDITSNKKTNAFNKTDEQACAWALLSALKAFQQRAIKEGASKVVNLTGYYKKQPFNSKTKFQCGAGAFVAGVTLKGDLAK